MKNVTEIIIMPVITTGDNSKVIKEGTETNKRLTQLLTDGYKITHLASSEFNGALYNTYILEKNFE